MKPTIYIIFQYDVVSLTDHAAVRATEQKIVFIGATDDATNIVDFESEADANAAMAEIKQGIVGLANQLGAEPWPVAVIVVKTPQERPEK